MELNLSPSNWKVYQTLLSQRVLVVPKQKGQVISTANWLV